MNSKAYLSLALFLSFGFGCSSTPTQSEEIQQASKIHNEMMKEAKELEKWLEQHEDAPSTEIPVDSIANWKNELESWEKEIVEVPGNEEHHHHEEGEAHDHSHHEDLQVTDQQMLTIQQDLNTRLSQLTSRIKSYRN